MSAFKTIVLSRIVSLVNALELEIAMDSSLWIAEMKMIASGQMTTGKKR